MFNHPFYGLLEIVVNDGMTGAHVKRSWKERLFSLPWSPWKKTRLDPNGGKPLIEDGQGYTVGNKVIMNSRTKKCIDDYIAKEGP